MTKLLRLESTVFVESRYPNMNGFLKEEDWLVVLIGGEMWNGQDKTCKSEKGLGRKGP